VYADGESHCLVSYWVDQVLGSLTKYSSLPVISRTHDQLGQVWSDREARDACGFAGTLTFDSATHAAVGITATSTGSCVFGVSGAQASGANVQKYETYGPETTTWFGILLFFFQFFFPSQSSFPMTKVRNDTQLQLLRGLHQSCQSHLN
jgi:hypothetical protein